MKILFKNYSLMRSAAAFTLAETLITLGIIGIVAVIVIPNFMGNVNQKQQITATNNFNRKFGEALRIMNSEGVLASQGTTENFVNTLSKYFKVIKTCHNTNLRGCFEQKITWSDGTDADISKFTTSNNIVDYKQGDSDWETNIVGVKFLNNVSALIAYNPSCQQNQFDNNLITVSGDKDSISFSTNDCIAMIYDINSNRKPNKIFQDVHKTDNVRNLKLVAIINGVKISKVAANKGLFYKDDPNAGGKGKYTCDEFREKYGTKYCCFTNDPLNYCSGTGDEYAQAIEACGSKDNLITKAEALKLMQYLYDDYSLKATDITPPISQRNEQHYNELVNYGIMRSGRTVIGLWEFGGYAGEHSVSVADAMNLAEQNVAVVRGVTNARGGWSNKTVICVER